MADEKNNNAEDAQRTSSTGLLLVLSRSWEMGLLIERRRWM
jgi:hypothetical protein